jgi:hypothetical protein
LYKEITLKKLNFIFIILIFINKIDYSQSIYFNKRIDITGSYEVCRGIINFNKGYLVAGGHVGNVIYMSFIDSLGSLKWTQHYNQPGVSYYFGLSGALFLTKDKCIAICGSRVPGSKGYGLIIKVDSLGNRKWEKEYKLTDCSNGFNNGTTTIDGGYILTGDANIIVSHYSYLLLKTDSLGNQQWYQTYTDNHPNRSYEGKSVIQTPDSGYCLGGGGVLEPTRGRISLNS